jgi:hypothetical protein
MGVRGQRHVPTALPPGKRPDTYCIGDWVGPRAGLDRYGKSRPKTGSDSRIFQPLPTQLPQWL